jgi:hypothetical protein
LVPIANAGENISEPSFRIDGIEPGGADRRVSCCNTLAASIGTGEQITTKRNTAQGILGNVVVDLRSAIVEGRVRATRRLSV